MMTSEVSQSMFETLLGYSSLDGQLASYETGDLFPAHFVSWHMAADFANHLTQFARDNYQLIFKIATVVRAVVNYLYSALWISIHMNAQAIDFQRKQSGSMLLSLEVLLPFGRRMPLREIQLYLPIVVIPFFIFLLRRIF